MKFLIFLVTLSLTTPAWSCINTQFNNLTCKEYADDITIETKMKKFILTKNSLSFIYEDNDVQSLKLPTKKTYEDGSTVHIYCSNEELIFESSIGEVTAKVNLKIKRNGFIEKGEDIDQTKRCRPNQESAEECKARPFETIKSPYHAECTEVKK